MNRLALKHLGRAGLFLIVFLVASTGFAMTSMKVTVIDATGKVAFKGWTNGDGEFATDALAPGKYIVQFNSAPSEVKGRKYAMIVSAGNKKVTAFDVAGEKFTGGGVAMRIAVESRQSISGQVASDLITMMKDGKKMVWIPKQLGSNLPAHWAEANSSDAKMAQTMASYSIKNIQDQQAQGVGLH